MKLRFKEENSGNLQLQSSYIGIIWFDYIFGDEKYINYHTKYPKDYSLYEEYIAKYTTPADQTWYDMIFYLGSIEDPDEKYEKCCTYLKEFKQFYKQAQKEFKQREKRFNVKRFIP